MDDITLKKMHKLQNPDIEALKALTSEELKRFMREGLKEVAEVDYPWRKWADKNIRMNAEKWIKIAPTRDTHDAIADYLSEGNMLSQEATQWFAQNVREPQRLNKKRGRKETPAYHLQIKIYIKLLIDHIDYKAVNAIEFVSDASGKSIDHVKAIWWD